MKRFILFVWFCLITASAWAQWSTATLSLQRSNMAATSAGNKVLFAGGGTIVNGSTVVSSVVDIYNASTNSWSTGSLSQARQGLCATSNGAKAFFAGGSDALGNKSAVVDIYDATNDVWSTATLSIARDYISAASAGSKVVFAGGQSLTAVVDRVDIYDVLSSTWTTSSLPMPILNLSSVSAGGKIYFAGGTSSGGSLNLTILVFDAALNSWSTLSLPTPRYGVTCAAVGTKVFFAGGLSVINGDPSSVVDIYDTATSSWSTASLSQARFSISASTIGSRVLFGGGIPATNSGSQVVDIFDNGTNSWTSATLTSSGFTVVSASTVNKVMFGGYDFSAVVDVYQVGVSSFTPTTGAVGDIVTISGSFSPPGGNTVKFNGVVGTTISESISTISVSVPIGSTTGPISVTSSGVTSTSAGVFSVTGSTAQTITFAALAAKTYGNAPFALTATASSGLTVTYSSSNPAVATVSGSTVTIVGAGTSTITASQAGNGTYRAAPDVARTLTVNKATQTITFAAISGKTYTSPDFTISPTSSSGLPVTVTNSNSAVIDFVSANTLHVYGVGTSNLTASQAGDNNYLAATNVVRTVTVNKATQTITFAAPPARTYDQVSYQLTATASSGLPITYTSSNTAVATIGGTNGDIATFTGVGTSTITANQAGNANFLAATAVARTLTVNKGNQTITFGPLNTVNYFDPDFNLTATASSGLPITYSSSNTAVATVADPDLDNIWTVHLVGAGTTNITASQAGNTLWNAATNVVQPLVSSATLLGPTVPSKFIEFTTVGSTSMNIGFIPGSGNKRLVVIKPTDPSNFLVPVNDQFYSAGFTSNGSTVVSSGTSSLVNVTGLSASTKYYVRVFEFNEHASNTTYLTTIDANAAQTTTATGGGGARMANVTAPVANPEPAPVAKPAQDYTRREFNVKISGNPFEDRLIFSVDSELSDASVALYDAAGRLVHQSTVPTNTTVEIAKPMNPGVYILRVQSGMDTKAVQVIKVK